MSISIMVSRYNMNLRNVNSPPGMSSVSEKGVRFMNKKKVAFIGRPFDDNWGLEDPTGKSDAEFQVIMEEIRKKILVLIDAMKATAGCLLPQTW